MLLGQGLVPCLITKSSITFPSLCSFSFSQRTHEQWQTLFFITASVCLFSMIIFLLCGSGELQPWAADTSDSCNHHDFPFSPQDPESKPMILPPKRTITQITPTTAAPVASESRVDGKKPVLKEVDDGTKVKTVHKSGEKSSKDKVRSHSDNMLSVKDKSNAVRRSRSKESRKSADCTNVKKRISSRESSPDGYESLSESHVWTVAFGCLNCVSVQLMNKTRCIFWSAYHFGSCLSQIHYALYHYIIFYP